MHIDNFRATPIQKYKALTLFIMLLIITKRMLSSEFDSERKGDREKNAF
jgi:hypothetical protein